MIVTITKFMVLFVQKKKNDMLLNKPFLLMRHGQTFSNTKELTCGSHNSMLTEKGRDDLKRKGNLFHFLNIKPRLIFHSSLSRSKDTAILVNQFINVSLIEKPLLNEQKFGSWELLPWQHIREKLDNQENPPDGESRNTFSFRIRDCLNSILGIPNNNFPLIVGHGGTFFAIGWLYEHMVKDIQNSEIYLFIPCLNDIFPWYTFRLNEGNDNTVSITQEIIYFPINDLPGTFHPIV